MTYQVVFERIAEKPSDRKVFEGRFDYKTLAEASVGIIEEHLELVNSKMVLPKTRLTAKVFEIIDYDDHTKDKIVKEIVV